MSSFSRRFCKRFALSGSFTVRSARPQPLDAVWRMDTNLRPRGRRAKTMPERALHAKAYGAEHAQRLFCAGSECEGWGACCAQHEYSWGAQRSRGGLKGHPPGISRKTGGNASSDRFR